MTEEQFTEASGLCDWCDEPIHALFLCQLHRWRVDAGWPEWAMRLPAGTHDDNPDGLLYPMMEAFGVTREELAAHLKTITRPSDPQWGRLFEGKTAPGRIRSHGIEARAA